MLSVIIYSMLSAPRRSKHCNTQFNDTHHKNIEQNNKYF
jgi:hypothetical protein